MVKPIYPEYYNAYKTYIQQITFDGNNYAKLGAVVDIMEKYNVCALEFPFILYPEIKDLAVRDWPGMDGRDVYIPPTVCVKEYELTATFAVKGTDEDIMANTMGFLDFICGRKGSDIDPLKKSARLAIYNAHTGIGRRDVYVKKVDTTAYNREASDDDKSIVFSITFSVEDPTTSVTLDFQNETPVLDIDA